MLQKYSLFIFILFLIDNSLCTIQTISQYGSLTTNSNEAFLDTSGFSVDEKIYIKVTTKNYAYCINGLDYDFYETNTGSYFNAYQHTTSSTTSSVSVGGSTETTYYYTVKKGSSKDNYLYMEFDCTGQIKIENTEDDDGNTIMIVAIVVSIVVVIIIIIIIVCVCRRCRTQGRVYGGVGYGTPYPVGAVGYGVTPYAVPIQPVVGVTPMQPVANVQPYGANYAPDPNYGQNIPNTPYSPVLQGSSSNRIEPNIQYEKPIA